MNWVFQLTRLVLRRQNQPSLLEVPETITKLFFSGKVGGKSLSLQMQTSDFEICRSTGNGL